jgi:hypothetical protein
MRAKFVNEAIKHLPGRSEEEIHKNIYSKSHNSDENTYTYPAPDPVWTKKWKDPNDPYFITLKAEYYFDKDNGVWTSIPWEKRWKDPDDIYFKETPGYYFDKEHGVWATKDPNQQNYIGPKSYKHIKAFGKKRCFDLCKKYLPYLIDNCDIEYVESEDDIVSIHNDENYIKWDYMDFTVGDTYVTLFIAQESDEDLIGIKFYHDAIAYNDVDSSDENYHDLELCDIEKFTEKDFFNIVIEIEYKN